VKHHYYPINLRCMSHNITLGCTPNLYPYEKLLWMRSIYLGHPKFGALFPMRVDENGYDVGTLKVINRLVHKPINPSYTSYTNSYTSYIH
jgi:hypothetical protein